MVLPFIRGPAKELGRAIVHISNELYANVESNFDGSWMLVLEQALKQSMAIGSIRRHQGATRIALEPRCSLHASYRGSTAFYKYYALMSHSFITWSALSQVLYLRVFLILAWRYYCVIDDRCAIA